MKRGEGRREGSLDGLCKMDSVYRLYSECKMDGRCRMNVGSQREMYGNMAVDDSSHLDGKWPYSERTRE